MIHKTTFIYHFIQPQGGANHKERSDSTTYQWSMGAAKHSDAKNVVQPSSEFGQNGDGNLL